MRHIDVTAAFLNGDIDQETFVSHPVNLPIRMKSNAYYRLQRRCTGCIRLHSSGIAPYEMHSFKNSVMYSWIAMALCSRT